MVLAVLVFGLARCEPDVYGTHEGQRCYGQCDPGLSCTDYHVPSALCVRDGTHGGVCRAAAPTCDPGLACDGTNCVTALGIGDACPVYGATCPAASSCAGSCTPDGARNGACRVGTPACDAGLACSPRPGEAHDVCVSAAGPGETCSLDHRGPECAAPDVCVPTRAIGAFVCGPTTYVETVIENPVFIDACDTSQDEQATHEIVAGAWGPFVDIPFPFQFFGGTFRTGWIWPNGTLAFGEVPAAAAPFAQVAGYRTFCTVVGSSSAFFRLSCIGNDEDEFDLDRVCVATVGASPHRVRVVEWFGDRSAARLETILHESTNAIDLLFDSARGPQSPRRSSHRIGISNEFGTDHLEHVGPVPPSRGVRFAPT